MDKEQFTARILALEKRMYHTAFSILRDNEDCADAMQNAVLAAWRKLGTLRRPEFFDTWVTRILINECYQIIRGRKDTVPYEEYEAVCAEPASEAYSPERQELFDEIMRLGEHYRLPIVLHYVEGYSVKETAKMLAITQAAVKQRLLRARRILKERLGGRS